MKRICTICARGGSKGVSGKNIRLLRGKPLIAHSIEQARASGLFEVIAVSSDSCQILEIAKSSGANIVVKRPDHLATDAAAKINNQLAALMLSRSPLAKAAAGRSAGDLRSVRTG